MTAGKPTTGSLWGEALGHLKSPAWRGLWVMALALGLVVGVGAARFIPGIDAQSADLAQALIVFFGAIFVALAVNALSVAALRIACAGERPTWRPDGAWWLYLLISIIAFGIPDVVAPVGANAFDWMGFGINALLFLAISALLVRWLTAVAVERPIPAPGPSLAQLGAYALPFTLALLPAAALSIACDVLLTQVMEASPGGDIPIEAFLFAIAFAPLTLIQLALAAAVYRQTETVEPAVTED